MKRLIYFIIVTFTITGFNSCGFDLSSSDNTIELPNTYGINVEVVFETPQFILDHEVKFDEISIIYKVRKNDAFAAKVKIYVSAETTADNLEMAGDEDVIDVTLGVNENEKSGTVTGQLIKDILNAKHPLFVIGAQNLSVSPISSVFIDLDVVYKGTYKL